MATAQFLGDQPPFDTLDHLAGWAANLGYEAVQVPCAPALIDLETAAESQDYCDDLRGRIADGLAQVVVIGAGFVGLEVAATARQKGCAVTVLEGAAAPLMRGLGAEMGEIGRAHV